MLNNDLYDLLNRFSKYQKIPFHIIKLINMMIIFSKGIFSEYSFQTIFKNKYDLSYSPEEMLEFFHTFNDIYDLVEGEDVPLDKPFISFKNLELEKELESSLIEVREEAIKLIYLDYSKYHFDPSQYNIFYTLRSRALISLDASFIINELLNHDDLYLGYYIGEVKFIRDHKEIIEHVEVTALDDAFDDVLEDTDYLMEEELLVDKSDVNSISIVASFIIDHLIKAYKKINKFEYINTALTYLVNELIRRDLLIHSNQQKDILLMIKILRELSLVRKLSSLEEDLLKNYYFIIKDTMDDLSISFILDMTITLLRASPKEGEKLVEQFFRFSSIEEFHRFAINHSLVHRLSDLEKIVIIEEA